MQCVCSLRIGATPGLYSLAYEIEAARDAFTQSALPQYRSQLDTTFANRSFYAIEHVECLAMQTFLMQLQMRITLESVIWLHGVWIPCAVSRHEIQYAEQAMLRTLSLTTDDEPFFRVRRLDELAATAKTELGLAPRRTTPCRGRTDSAPVLTSAHPNASVQAARVSHNNDAEYLGRMSEKQRRN